VNGAGPLAGTTLAHKLDNAAAPSILTSLRSGGNLAMPPAVVRVGAGDSEDVAVLPEGHRGFYEWGVTLDLVVDQRSQRVSFGSPAHPLRSFLSGRAPLDYSYNPSTRSWVRSHF
jgi:hypothetical protein